MQEGSGKVTKVPSITAVGKCQAVCAKTPALKRRYRVTNSIMNLWRLALAT